MADSHIRTYMFVRNGPGKKWSFMYANGTKRQLGHISQRRWGQRARGRF